MKKMILTLAIILGACVFAKANSATNENVLNDNTAAISFQVNDEYKEVALEDLTETLQNAIKGYEEEFNIKKIEYCPEKDLTRVTLESKLNGLLTIIVLDKNGKTV